MKSKKVPRLPHRKKKSGEPDKILFTTEILVSIMQGVNKCAKLCSDVNTFILLSFLSITLDFNKHEEITHAVQVQKILWTPIKRYSYQEANSFSASQEIPGLLFNPKIAHCIQYNRLLPSVRNIQSMLSCPTYNPY